MSPASEMLRRRKPPLRAVENFGRLIAARNLVDASPEILGGMLVIAVLFRSCRCRCASALLLQRTS